MKFQQGKASLFSTLASNKSLKQVIKDKIEDTKQKLSTAQAEQRAIERELTAVNTKLTQVTAEVSTMDQDIAFTQSSSTAVLDKKRTEL
jgi:chromosome segregation ATPase